MRIATIGRGNVGGGLAKRWRVAGHEVTELGREGGDVTDADVVLVALPSNAIADALGKISGLEGQVVIDTTNAFTGRAEGFDSLTEEIKSHTGGPVAKSFNCNYAVLYDEIDSQRVPPCCLYAAEDDAVEVTEQLIRDAGYLPVSAGGLENARLLEDHLFLMNAINNGGLGRYFYRFAKPGEL